jgi:hypothetical protein
VVELADAMDLKSIAFGHEGARPSFGTGVLLASTVINLRRSYMTKKVEVARIVIKVGEKELSFTLDEAKEMKELLSKILGEDKVVYVPSSPIYIEVERPRRWIGIEPYPYTTYPIYTSNTWNVTYSSSDKSVCFNAVS